MPLWATFMHTLERNFFTERSAPAPTSRVSFFVSVSLELCGLAKRKCNLQLIHTCFRPVHSNGNCGSKQKNTVGNCKQSCVFFRGDGGSTLGCSHIPRLAATDDSGTSHYRSIIFWLVSHFSHVYSMFSPKLHKLTNSRADI